MNYFSLIILSFILSFSAFAQPEKVKAKIITGLMGAQIDGDRLAGYDKPGGILGMAMELKLAKRFSVQPEIMYCQKGARSSNKSLYYTIVRLNYIDLAGVLNFYLNDKWVLQPGITYGILFRARTDYGGGFVSSNRYFNQGDFGYMFGVEYRLSTKVGVNIRYAHSLVSISPYTQWYNNTLSFSLRFLLGE